MSWLAKVWRVLQRLVGVGQAVERAVSERPEPEPVPVVVTSPRAIPPRPPPIPPKR